MLNTYNRRQSLYAYKIYLGEKLMKDFKNNNKKNKKKQMKKGKGKWMESFSIQNNEKCSKKQHFLVYRFGDRLVWKVAETIKSKI